MKQSNMAIHSFYCIQCGNKSMDLSRKKGHLHKQYHRKKLYCPWCKTTINHVECRDEFEVYEFKQAFLNEEFAKEVAESLEHTYGDDK